MENRRKREMKYYCEESSNQQALLDIQEIHFPYDIPQYHDRVLNRGLLTHQQYTDFLATPKGYRWDKETGLIKRFKWTPEKQICFKKKPCLKKYDDPLIITDQRYIRNFLTDIWNYLTPEMLEKLKSILMTDLGMNEVEAERFLIEQRIRSTFGRQVVAPRTLLSKRHVWVRDLARTLAGKLRDYLLLTFSSERDQRVRCLTRVLVKKMGLLTGEECDPQDRPQDLGPLQAAQLLAADRLAVWLAKILAKEKDLSVCREELLKKEEEARRRAVEHESQNDPEPQPAGA